MNQATTAATTATTVPASMVLIMKGNERARGRRRRRPNSVWARTGRRWREPGDSRVVPVVGGRGFLSGPENDETAGRRGQDLDGGAVELRERPVGDDVARRAGCRTAPGEVDDLVDVTQDRIDVVGDHDHGDVLGPADLSHERRDRRLVRQVEALQRLVEQQELGPGGEGLGDE